MVSGHDDAADGAPDRLEEPSSPGLGRRTTAATRSAAVVGSSCSQTRTVVQPASSRILSVSRSRSRVRAIFAAQKSALVFAIVWCSGQPCQKQPSRKTATLARVNTRSAVRLIAGSGREDTRYLRPRAWTAERRRTSGRVSRPLFACMQRRTPSLSAQPSPVPAATSRGYRLTPASIHTAGATPLIPKPDNAKCVTEPAEGCPADEFGR
jgi:hypothetical protein